MRADELVRTLAASQRALLAKTYQADSSEVATLVQAMRAENVAEVLAPIVRRKKLAADIASLCANPFDPVYDGDVSDMDSLASIGLVCRGDDGGWQVNIDLALALVPSIALEFGFALTLLARLSPSDFQSTARALGVSPQMNRTDYLLAVADAMCSQATLERVIMQMREEERAVLASALEEGELPDDLSSWSPELALPRVTLHSSEAGRRGVLLSYAQISFGVASRPLLPLESVEAVEDALANIPAPPPLQTKPGRRRAQPAQRPQEGAAPKAVLLDFSTPAFEAPPAHSRQVTVVESSGVVELQDEAMVQRLRDLPQLYDGVARVFERTRVLLRPGVDSHRWSEQAALLLGEDDSTRGR